MARIRIAGFGQYGVSREQYVTGPRAISSYLSRYPDVAMVSRYHDGPSKRRLTRKGAAEFVIRSLSGDTHNITITAIRNT